MRVLITGANRGVGAALRDVYLGRGATVLGTRRSDGDADGWIETDVTAPDFEDRVTDALGTDPLDLLIANAGVLLDRADTLAQGYPVEDWETTFAVNVTGVFRTVRAALPALRRASGKIGIISSQLGSSEIASGGRYIYCASKAAALNLGRNLAVDLRDDRIAVGIYHPGWVRTDMGTDAAAISPEDSASGLTARFDALSLGTTGTFETWDGQAHPF